MTRSFNQLKITLLQVASGLAASLFISGCKLQPSSTQSTALPQPHASTDNSLFHDEAHHAGLTLQWGPRDPTKLTILDMMGFGCAFLDYDGDNRLDILLVARDHVELYRNRGDGTFENVTDRAFPNAPRIPYLMGCTVCDYDGDGRPDIFVTGHGRTILYHNEGNGTFKDVTKGSGLEATGPEDWTTSAAWADLAGDGLPDLYVCRYIVFGPESKQLMAFDALDGTTVMQSATLDSYQSERGSLYHNEGGGKFHDITRAAGLADTAGNGLGCMFCDFNNSGTQGLFIANDQRPQDLYVNVGRERFKNISDSAGIAYDLNGKLNAGMGVDWGDYRNEGKFDLLIGTFSNQPKCLYHNEGHGLFVNEAASSGISVPSLTSLTFGAKFVDLDNSGRLDIVLVNGHVYSLVERTDSTTTYREPCLLFHNEGNGSFTNVSNRAGPDFIRKIAGRGIAVGDYDGDGRLDLVIVDAEGNPLLLHNDGPHSHYLGLRCLSANGKSDALGARVTILNSGMSQTGEVRASGSYLSSDAPDLHFGLGSSARADSVAIRWPDGKASRFTAVAADHSYVVSHTDDTIKLIR